TGAATSAGWSSPRSRTAARSRAASRRPTTSPSRSTSSPRAGAREPARRAAGPPGPPGRRPPARRPCGAGSATASWGVAECRWSSSPQGRRPRGTILLPGPRERVLRLSRTRGGNLVDIDMTALRGLESEKDISLEVAVKAIEDALLIAYHRTEGAAPKARVELDRETGHGTVWATEIDDEGNEVREYDDTPTGFGRIAATTAKQVILQRLRDAEDELTFGEYAGREGDIVSGIIQQGKDPRNVLVDLGRIEAVLPPQEQVPGERYEHGDRLRAYVVQVRKGHRGPS